MGAARRWLERQTSQPACTASQAMGAAKGVRAWVDEALREKEIVPEDEPYAQAGAAT